MFEKIMMLQLFADAGSNINGTTKYGINATTPNSGTARGDNSSTTHMDTELKTYYDTELLENARQAQVYAQFGRKQTLPMRHGKTVEWRKWNTFAKASELEEGVYPTGQTFGMTYKTGSIKQYGTYTSISDQLELHAFDDIILGATEEMGASAAATQETLISDALMANTNAMYCDTLDANGAYTGTPTKCSDLAHSTTNGYSFLTPDMVNKAVTKMKKMKAPTINGKYVMVIHPSVSYDLRKSKDWINAHVYAAPEELFNGEIGELHGVRFIENPDAPVCFGGDTETGYKTKDNGKSYACFLFGKDAFGLIEAAGGNLEMIVHGRDEIGGPLNQYSTIGYKFESNGATILYPERVLRIMAASAYSATDDANYTV